MDWRHELEKLGCVLTPTGSTVICPDQPAKDEDWVVDISGTDRIHVYQELRALGFVSDWEVEETPEDYEDNNLRHSVSWRMGHVNAIVVKDKDEAELWRAATRKAIELKLCSRAERIALFKEFFKKEPEPIVDEVPF